MASHVVTVSAMTSLPLGRSSSVAETAAARAGDAARERERRFTWLFESHHDDVWRALHHLGVHSASVDDATQQVFLIAARRLDDIRDGAERHFLYGVALRVASDHRRRNAAVRFPPSDTPLEAIVDHADTAHDRLVENEALSVLDGVLAELPEDLRQVLVLVELEGMAVSEVASLLSLPYGTAASRLRRAREAFSEGARRARARLERGAK